MRVCEVEHGRVIVNDQDDLVSASLRVQAVARQCTGQMGLRHGLLR